MSDTRTRTTLRTRVGVGHARAVTAGSLPSTRFAVVPDEFVVTLTASAPPPTGRRIVVVPGVKRPFLSLAPSEHATTVVVGAWGAGNGSQTAYVVPDDDDDRRKNRTRPFSDSYVARCFVKDVEISITERRTGYRFCAVHTFFSSRASPAEGFRQHGKTIIVRGRLRAAGSRTAGSRGRRCEPIASGAFTRPRTKRVRVRAGVAFRPPVRACVCTARCCQPRLRNSGRGVPFGCLYGENY